jgi:hypothetical protein
MSFVGLQDAENGGSSGLFPLRFGNVRPQRLALPHRAWNSSSGPSLWALKTGSMAWRATFGRRWSRCFRD